MTTDTTGQKHVESLLARQTLLDPALTGLTWSRSGCCVAGVGRVGGSRTRGRRGDPYLW
jgi:hypothetical protein